MRYHDPKMNKVKLHGKLKGTVSWVEIKTDGGLRLEFFDYSEDAQVLLGHDVAYLIHLSPEEKRQVMAFLNIADNDLTHPDVMLLERMVGCPRDLVPKRIRRDGLNKQSLDRIVLHAHPVSDDFHPIRTQTTQTRIDESRRRLAAIAGCNRGGRRRRVLRA
jgi:hypothetical protein